MMMPTSAIASVLGLPEILSAIFRFLDDDSLRKSITVTRAWFAVGSGVLWEKAYARRFERIRVDRQQLYASKVRELSITDASDRISGILNNLRFDTIKEVIFRAPSMPSESFHLQPYMQPSLKTLRILGHAGSGDFIHRLQVFGPQLLHLDFGCWGATPERVLDFIIVCPKLLSIRIGHNLNKWITEKIILQLAERKNLERLEIMPTTTPEHLSGILPSLDTPFSALKWLNISIKSASVMLIPRLFRNLEGLVLKIQGDERDPLELVGTMTRLRVLHLDFDDNEHPMNVKRLGFLQSLCNLEDLSLCRGEQSTPAKSTIPLPSADESFQRLIMQLPALRRLKFKLLVSLTTESLAMLGSKCPWLEICVMTQKFCMRGLRARTHDMALFPKLKELEIGGILLTEPGRSYDYDNGDPIQEIVTIMRKHFPNLSKISFGARIDPVSDRVQNALHSAIHAHRDYLQDLFLRHASQMFNQKT